MSASCSALDEPDLLSEDLLEMLSMEPEDVLLEETRPEVGGAMAGLGGRVLLDLELTDIFSAATEFLELGLEVGLEVFTGRLERGGGGGIVTSLSTWGGKYSVILRLSLPLLILVQH